MPSFEFCLPWDAMLRKMSALQAMGSDGAADEGEFLGRGRTENEKDLEIKEDAGESRDERYVT